MCLRGTQTHENNKEFFLYFEPLRNYNNLFNKINLWYKVIKPCCVGDAVQPVLGQHE